LKTPDLLASILKALVEEVGKEFEIGISVKIRLLETPELTESLVRKLCATGITGLTVHCRTTPMRPRERALREQLRMIADICRENGVASVMNGDVENREQALALTEEFGVDGAMIATAAETNSSCFRAKEAGGLAPWNEVVDLYMRFSIEVENRWGNTKYLLGHLIPGKLPVHKKVVGTKNYSQACEVLELQHLKELALETDTKLGLLPHLQEQTKWAKKRKNKAADLEKGRQKQQRVISLKASPEASQKVETQPEIHQDNHAVIALAV
jgi:tRNA-dihydrouridine synthase 2